MVNRRFSWSIVRVYHGCHGQSYNSSVRSWLTTPFSWYTVVCLVVYKVSPTCFFTSIIPCVHLFHRSLSLARSFSLVCYLLPHAGEAKSHKESNCSPVNPPSNPAGIFATPDACQDSIRSVANPNLSRSVYPSHPRFSCSLHLLIQLGWEHFLSISEDMYEFKFISSMPTLPTQRFPKVRKSFLGRLS